MYADTWGGKKVCLSLVGVVVVTSLFVYCGTISGDDNDDGGISGRGVG